MCTERIDAALGPPAVDDTLYGKRIRREEGDLTCHGSYHPITTTSGYISVILFCLIAE